MTAWLSEPSRRISLSVCFALHHVGCPCKARFVPDGLMPNFCVFVASSAPLLGISLGTDRYRKGLLPLIVSSQILPYTYLTELSFA